MVSASAGVIWKNSGSNRSKSSSSAAQRAWIGVGAPVPASKASGTGKRSIGRMAQCPSRRLRQKTSTFGASGNRPARPTMAIRSSRAAGAAGAGDGCGGACGVGEASGVDSAVSGSVGPRLSTWAASASTVA